MWRLYSSSCINRQMIDDVEFIDSLITNEKIQSQIAPRVLDLGIVEFCQHVCRKKMFRKKFFDSIDNGLMKLGTTAVLSCLGCVVNLTDISADACQRVLEIGLHEDLFRFLNLDKMDPSKVKFCYIHSGLADTVMSLAYNVIQVSCLFYVLSIFVLYWESILVIVILSFIR